MIQEQHLKEELSFTVIKLDLYPAGEDVVAVLTGGENPHVGCAVIAVPRLSLSGNGNISCTSSVINVIGHKDEVLCRRVAEELCNRFGVSVACTGGVHLDEINDAQIVQIQNAVERLIGQTG